MDPLFIDLVGQLTCSSSTHGASSTSAGVMGLLPPPPLWWWWGWWGLGRVKTPSFGTIAKDVSTRLPLFNATDKSFTTWYRSPLLNRQYSRNSSNAAGFSMAKGHCISNARCAAVKAVPHTRTPCNDPTKCVDSTNPHT
jgi:hypothetical protein